MREKLNNSRIFEEVYCGILLIIAILGWKFNCVIGISIIVGIAAISLIFLNNFKYMIPSFLFFIFSNNSGFELHKFPVHLIVTGSILIILLFIYSIRNIKKIKKSKFFITFVIMAILCFLPFFWNRSVISSDNKVLYFMYFAWTLYLILYVIFSTSLDKNCFSMLVKAFSYLVILFVGQCSLKVLELHLQNPEQNILSFLYYLGWGLCNEAGIMMGFCMPFVFIELIYRKHIGGILFSIFKICIIPIGLLLTGSRGTVLFCGIEFGILLILSLVFMKNKKIGLPIVLTTILIAIVCLFCIIDVNKLINDIIVNLFEKKFDDNGRKYLWNISYDIWNKNELFRWLGAGLVCDFYVSDSYFGQAMVFTVFHSTVFETITCFGIIGGIIICVLIFQKYYQIFKFNKIIMMFISIGYIFIDLYGLIDNTYHMYYYMIPLIISIGAFDNLQPIKT